MDITTVACILGGYALGSIPFGLIFTKLAGYGDIRTMGSGNIGATNVLRSGNRKIAALTLLFDAGKSAVAYALSLPFIGDAAIYAGFAAFLGHVFPIWLGFRGGKGIATGLGLYAAVNPILAVCLCLLWLAVALITRYSSLAGLVAFAAAPAIAFVMEEPLTMVWLSLAIFLLVLLRHESNIRRLAKGEEGKLKL